MASVVLIYCLHTRPLHAASRCHAIKSGFTRTGAAAALR